MREWICKYLTFLAVYVVHGWWPEHVYLRITPPKKEQERRLALFQADIDRHLREFVHAQHAREAMYQQHDPFTMPTINTAPTKESN